MPALIAFNPLTWLMTPDGFDPAGAPPMAEIYRQIGNAGFTAAHTDLIPGLPAAEQRSMLADAGLVPAPGYFQAHFAADLTDTLELAGRTAGHHAELGLDRIFIAEQFGAQPRLERPAAGADADPKRTEHIADGLTRVCERFVAEGVTPCLHQHIGTWIETVDEMEAILAAIDPTLLLFGPDTGHLSWAGADPAATITRHLDRVGAVHLKDFRSAIAERAGSSGYQRAVAAHVWTEPGRGDVDFPATIAALHAFEGWYVVEVDLPDQPSPFDSAATSARWVAETMGQARA